MDNYFYNTIDHHYFNPELLGLIPDFDDRFLYLKIDHRIRPKGNNEYGSLYWESAEYFGFLAPIVPTQAFIATHTPFALEQVYN